MVGGGSYVEITKYQELGNCRISRKNKLAGCKKKYLFARWGMCGGEVESSQPNFLWIYSLRILRQTSYGRFKVKIGGGLGVLWWYDEVYGLAGITKLKLLDIDKRTGRGTCRGGNGFWRIITCWNKFARMRKIAGSPPPSVRIPASHRPCYILIEWSPPYHIEWYL